MKKALLGNTKIEPGNSEAGDTEVGFNVLATTTEGAILTGGLCAVAGGIEYVVNKMAPDYDAFDQIIFTGGDAERLKPYLSMQVETDDTLVLDGLKVVSEIL